MRKKLFSTVMASGALVLGAASFMPALASAAAPTTYMYQANLTSLNNSGTTGTSTVKVTGDQATVTVHTMGASANLPHAQHIHIGGNHTCPTMADDTNGDGVLSTAEGQPDYGKVQVSLTKTGDVSAKSALAVDRFPTASKSGEVTYSRTFTLPSGVTASDVAHGVIVQHGVSEIGGDKAKYDGSAKSSLDPSLPLEATAPNACGVLTAMPVGGAATGTGSTAGIEDKGLLALGGASIIAAAAFIGARLYAAKQS